MAQRRSSIYQLKVALKNTRPPIWRRILVPSDIALSDLHHVLQIAMGWETYHMHRFVIGREEYQMLDPDSPALEWGAKDEGRVRLSTVVRRPKQKFLYEYDFGDGWEHTIVLEKTLEPEEGKRYPVCIAAKRACPPEDCGGPWGYAELLEALGDPGDPRHEEMSEWAGEDFDPEAVSLDEINAALSPAGRHR